MSALLEEIAIAITIAAKVVNLILNYVKKGILIMFILLK